MLTPMTRVRMRTAAVGSAVVTATAVLIAHGSVLGADLPKVALLGAAAGAVLALVPGRPGDSTARLGSFATGFAASLVGLWMLRSFLPDVPVGRAISATAVLSLVVAASVATADRLPLWAGLLGVATFAGSFATVVGGAIPTTTTAVTALTCAALTGAVTFLLGTLVTGLTSPIASTTATDVDDLDVALPTPRAAADSDVPSNVKAAR
jgi:hypothetical protein